MSFTRLFGLGLAATGAAHFVAPDAFVPLTKVAFPEDTHAWIKHNGTIELGLGVAIAAKPTRGLGFAGLAVYGGWLASKALAAR